MPKINVPQSALYYQALSIINFVYKFRESGIIVVGYKFFNLELVIWLYFIFLYQFHINVQLNSQVAAHFFYANKKTQYHRIDSKYDSRVGYQYVAIYGLISGD